MITGLIPAVLFLPVFSAFSTPSSSSGSGGDAAGFFKLDRFRPSCPADITSIRQFDRDLVTSEDNGIWVAVYRSNNNKPSVFVRDEFFHAMSDAISDARSSGKSQQRQQQQQTQQVDSSKLSTPMALEKPVAVARLRPSDDFENKWILDSMRCHLKKEEMDKSCDGGSEFVEALSVCVDSLLLHHLKENQTGTFEGSIRTKATLFSNKILEERGFSPVEELSRDMASHVSSYETCMESYASRTCSKSVNPGGRDRALQMVSLLGKLDEEAEMKAKKEADENDEDNKDDYDPWANIKMQI
eukprot:scaffold24174_cov117-Cylindrotheca_fusiformis.AAC.4